MFIFVFLGVLIVVTILQAILQNNVEPDSLGLIDHEFKPIPNNKNGISTMAIEKIKRIDSLPYLGSKSLSVTQLTDELEKNENMQIRTVSDNYIHATIMLKLPLYIDAEFVFDDILSKIHVKLVPRVPFIKAQAVRKQYSELKREYLKAF